MNDDIIETLLFNLVTDDNNVSLLLNVDEPLQLNDLNHDDVFELIVLIIVIVTTSTYNLPLCSHY